MTKKIRISVLLADDYDIAIGKKIEFERKDDFLFAMIEGNSIGLVKEIKRGTQGQLKELGDTFSGVIVKKRNRDILVDVVPC